MISPINLLVTRRSGRIEPLNEPLDFTKPAEPEPTVDLRESLTNWLGYQRQQFIRKLRDLDPVAAAEHAVPPLALSVLGLVRHMTQMEHVYLAWGLGGGERHLVYGEDDFEAGSADTYIRDVSLYLAEVAKATEASTRWKPWNRWVSDMGVRWVQR